MAAVFQNCISFLGCVCLGGLLIVSPCWADWDDASKLCDMLAPQEIHCPRYGEVEVPNLTEGRRGFIRALAKLSRITVLVNESGIYIDLEVKDGVVLIREQYSYREGTPRYVKPYNCIRMNPGGSIFDKDNPPVVCKKETPMIRTVYHQKRGTRF